MTTPAGKPASSQHSASMYASSGDSGDGFITTVQPASSARATLMAIAKKGAFHGAIAATTPTGSRTTIATLPGYIVGRSSCQLCASALRAWNANISIDRSVPAWEKVYTAPICPLQACASSSVRRWSAATRHPARSPGVMRGQDPRSNASRAASTAARTSSACASATRSATSSVTGLTTSIVRDEDGCTHSPPMRKRSGCATETLPNNSVIHPSPSVSLPSGPFRPARGIVGRRIARGSAAPRPGSVRLGLFSDNRLRAARRRARGTRNAKQVRGWG